MSDWNRILDEIERGTGARVLVTIASLEGSAPRDPGAKMLVGAEELHGTIGGGRLEQEATALARAMLGAVSGAGVRRVSLGPRLGQCCGGSVVLLLEPLRDLGWFAAVRAQGRARRACVVATVTATSEDAGVPVGAKLVLDGARVAWGRWDVPALETAVAAECASLFGRAEARPRTIVVGEHAILLEPVPVEAPILVFGAGHVGRALVTILGLLPRPITWVDSRADAFPSVLPGNVTAEASDIPELEVDAAPPGSSYVVMTHSHALDLALVERVLLRADFAYLGLIGSATKRQRFERRLALRGLAPEALARLRCPIGMEAVGGKHPGEIAVAVVAELLAVRSGAVRAHVSAR